MALENLKNEAIMEKHKLNFINPQYRKGINVTTRLGTKWAMKISIGDTVTVSSNNYRSSHQNGEILGAFIGEFNLIPDEFIRLQHSQDTQTRHGLAEIMRESYGAKFEMDSICTVILFKMPSNAR